MALFNFLRQNLPPTTRVQNIILQLLEYTFRIKHQHVKANVIADVLLRLHYTRWVKSKTTERNTCPTFAAEATAINKLSASPEGSLSAPLAAGGFSKLPQWKWNSLALQGEKEDPSKYTSDSEAEKNGSNHGHLALLYYGDANRSDIALPLINVPIAQERQKRKKFLVPARQEIAAPQQRDFKLLEFCTWIKIGQEPPKQNFCETSRPKMSEVRYSDRPLKTRRNTRFHNHTGQYSGAYHSILRLRSRGRPLGLKIFLVAHYTTLLLANA